MLDKKVLLITGAGRGMGVDFVKAALEAGHNVIATGRNPEAVAKAVGNSPNLLVLKLDITNRSDCDSAVKSAVDKFGRLDVLINNAGNFYAGFFEDHTPEEFAKQMETNFFGPVNITRSVLPVMRKQHSGHIVTISSTASFKGIEFGSAYSASKYATDGWMLSIEPEIAPFGIKTTIVNPGFFRTELISVKSMTFTTRNIDDYKSRREQLQPAWNSMGGKQSGDPKKLAAALMKIINLEKPPRRLMAGADAVEDAKKTAHELIREAEAYEELSSSMALES
jgi:NAD(P)-dependent dehydrogenase (short-subunit alcohol dehydrogenase family)